MKRHILIFAEQFWPNIGGLETLLLQMSLALNEQGHRVSVITSQASAQETHPDSCGNIPIYRLPFWQAVTSGDPMEILQTSRALRKLLTQLQPDIVHVHAVAAAGYFFQQTRSHIPDTPYIFTVHTPLFGIAGKNSSTSLLGLLMRDAAAVTTVSAYMAADLQKFRPEFNGVIQVIHNALPPQPDDVDAETEPLFDFLFLGRLVEEKGADIAIKAFHRAFSGSPQHRLVVAGDGPEKPALEQLCAELGCTDNVELRGWIQPEDTHRLIRQCRAVVMPSRYSEPFGLVALESLRARRPAIVSSVGGLPEVVFPNYPYCFADGDIAGLSKIMAAILQNPETASRVATKGADWIASEFRFEPMLDKYLDCYSAVMR